MENEYSTYKVSYYRADRGIEYVCYIFDSVGKFIIVW
jgi:hypothetical protein